MRPGSTHFSLPIKAYWAYANFPQACATYVHNMRRHVRDYCTRIHGRVFPASASATGDVVRSHGGTRTTGSVRRRSSAVASRAIWSPATTNGQEFFPFSPSPGFSMPPLRGGNGQSTVACKRALRADRCRTVTMYIPAASTPGTTGPNAQTTAPPKTRPPRRAPRTVPAGLGGRPPAANRDGVPSPGVKRCGLTTIPDPAARARRPSARDHYLVAPWVLVRCSA